MRRYLALLYGVASTLARRLPTIEPGKAISSGFLGLAQAIERFDPNRGHSFATFACPRIRGAVLDEMRRQSTVPRTALARHRRLGQASQAGGRRRHRGSRRGDLCRAAGVGTALGVSTARVCEIVQRGITILRENVQRAMSGGTGELVSA